GQQAGHMGQDTARSIGLASKAAETLGATLLRLGAGAVGLDQVRRGFTAFAEVERTITRAATGLNLIRDQLAAVQRRLTSSTETRTSVEDLAGAFGKMRRTFSAAAQAAGILWRHPQPAGTDMRRGCAR